MHRHCLGTMILLFATVVASLTGCAEQQPVINRVQPYALPKSLFTGEWYYHKTVIDTPGTNTVAFVGETSWGSQFRIRWEIQEHFLYARTSYETIDGAKVVNEDTGEYLGEIVGAWKILSHFDLKRGYNPVTGETTNVLTENAQDCKWYDCTYIHVDWSTNQAVDVNFLQVDRGLRSIMKDPMAFFPQDESDAKYRPVFDQEAGYIDVTTAMAIHPQDLYIPYYDLVLPVCWFFFGANVSCNTEVVKVRNSFWRRDPNHDYEPRLHKGEKDEWFGYFVEQRFNWYSEQGLTFKTKKHYMNRHNIWEKNHESSACTDDNQCGQFGSGSRCDKEIAFHKFDVAKDSDADGLADAYEEAVGGLSAGTADSDGDGVLDAKDDANGNGIREIEDFWAWDRANLEFRCTIPLERRVPKPIVYFNSGDFPRSLVCDENYLNVSKDFETGPCQPWKWSADRKVREDTWASLHKVHENYNEAFFKVYLRGAYGWSDEEYTKWITTHDVNQFSGGRRQQLEQFGDNEHGYYAFALCPNNPVDKNDPWPCRFPRHSFAQAKDLMGRGLTFNHLLYEQAKQALDEGREVDQTPPLIRIGDMRYSLVHWDKNYSPAAPLGYGPNAADVRTGEIISGFANLYVACDYVTTRLNDLIKVLNGEIASTEYVDGLDVRQWVERINGELSSAQDDNPGATSGYQQRVISPTQLGAIYDAMEQPWMKKIAPIGKPEQLKQMHDSEGYPLGSIQLRRKLVDTLAESGIFDPAKAKVDLSAIRGTQLERRMIDEDVLMAAGYGPGEVSDITDSVLGQVSLARGGFLKKLQAREYWRKVLADRYAVDWVESVDEGLTGLATRLKGLPAETRWAKIRDTMNTPVLVHEMGHSLGLMHNFGGSDDALNYHPEYWRLRTNDGADKGTCNHTAPGNGQLCPFYVRPMNNYQLGRDSKNLQQGLKAMTEYAYSSIMDYDRYSTLMGLGLGRYDLAAFIYGYTDKVEVFKDPGQVSLSPNIFEQWHAGDGTVMILDTQGPRSFHYTNWYTLMGDKAHQESNRMLVDYREMQKLRDQTGANQGWFHVNGNTKLVRVPYIYCSHSRSNISGTCMTWDWGADYYERMKMHVDNWDMWYIQNSFPRGRFYWSPGGYVGRRYRYFYQRLKDFNNSYALYQGLLRQWYDSNIIKTFMTDPVNGWGDYTMAMHDGFNTAMRTLAMPDIKDFDDLTVQPDGQTIYSEADFGSLFQTTLNNGRYFDTSYYNTNFEQPGCGAYWWECLHHIGFYMDKIMSLVALSDPYTYFVGQDTAEDIRTYRISFFDNFSTQIVDFMGAMLGEDYNAISPWFDPNKPRDQIVTDTAGTRWINGIALRNYVTPELDPPKPATGGAVEAATRFTLQLYGAVMGILLFQNNFDTEYVERGRMWKKGKGTQWTITPTQKVTGESTYINPFNGTTYVGIAFADGKGIAQRMIAHANALKARSHYCNPNPGLPASCGPLGNKDDATADLKSYDDLLDVMVQVTTIYDTLVGNWGEHWLFDP